jgi:GDP/UDP-N,N'-diacetylbacillosamine 2-epimerase (hydrolysing)
LTQKDPSLGQLHYLSCLKHVDGVVGNSSSGLLEAPSFKKGTINIGDRQRGRLKAQSVIDCKPKYESILAAINMLFSKKFQAFLPMVQNPYGNGGASEAIVKVLENQLLENLLKKTFYKVS